MLACSPFVAPNAIQNSPPLNANQQGVSGNRDLVYISTKINKMNMAMPFVITYYNIQVAPSVVLSAIFFTGETILRPSKFLKSLYITWFSFLFSSPFFISLFCIIHLPLNILHLSLIS